MTIKEKLNKYIEVRNDLQREAKHQFKSDECPLKDEHYFLSAQLFGTGAWRWTCDFCGEEFEE